MSHEHDERCLLDCFRCRKPIIDFRNTLWLPDRHTIHKTCGPTFRPIISTDRKP